MSVYTNTDPISEDVKAVQIKPTTSVVSTQSEIVTNDNYVQTQAPSTDDMIATRTGKYEKKSLLQVQILPQINIPSSLVVQRILEFSINPKGNTELSYKADLPNVSFLEITSSKMETALTDVNYDIPERKSTVVSIQNGIKWFHSPDQENTTSKREDM